MFLYSLPSGLRLLHEPSSSAVAYVGIAVSVGSRDELSGEEGLAHFCEHLAFKGTARRSARRIRNQIESLGGSLEAYTTKETTVYYAAIGSGHVRLALDLIEDIVFHAAYPEAEVEREREVVCDEIESYNDSPADLIWDDFDNLLFAGSPLGHNILGTAESVRHYQAADARAFRDRLYTTGRALAFCFGGGKAELGIRNEALGMSSRTISRDSSAVVWSDKARELIPHSSFLIPHSDVIVHKDTHQAHVMLGRVAYSFTDPRRHALQLLSNMLGGPALGARLNVALRERNALVYTVESSCVCYRDTGSWAIYYGCDASDIKRCRRLVARELDRLMQSPLTPRALAAAKRQFIGQIAIAADNRENIALDAARLYLHTGRLYDPDDRRRQIEDITAEDLLQVARDIFPEQGLTRLTYA